MTHRSARGHRTKRATSPHAPRRAAEVLARPEWFLDHLDAETSKARFVQTDRDTLSRQAFLDPRWDRAALPVVELPMAALGPSGQGRPQLNFIWHTSFCCSTLLAAALDVRGLNLALKEPTALVDLADLKRARPRAKLDRVASAVFELHARRFSRHEQILLKPSNFANNLIAEAARTVDGRMLMMFSSCRNFLISILKQGEERRSYVRDLFVSLTEDGHPQGQWPLGHLLALSDMQVAALSWHLQMAHFQKVMRSLGERAASLDGDRFLSDVRGGLRAVDAFFGLGLGASRIAVRARSSHFERNSKSGRAFDGAARQAAIARIEAEAGPFLDRLIDWAGRASGLPTPTLPHGLV